MSLGCNTCTSSTTHVVSVCLMRDFSDRRTIQFHPLTHQHSSELSGSLMTTEQVMASGYLSQIPLGFMVASAALLLALYKITSPHFSSNKQRAWILSTTVSAVMTLSSLPFIMSFLSSFGSVSQVHSYGAMDQYLLRFFQAFLISDLIIGFLSYREEVDMISGWAHHVVYLGIVEIAIHNRLTEIFCLCFIMELPTFVLGMGKIAPTMRSNHLFAITFFLTRIFFHAVLIVSYTLPHNRIITGNLPPIILGLLFCLHSFWFYGCIRGFVRRAKSSKEVEAVEKHEVSDVKDGIIAMEQKKVIQREITPTRRMPAGSS
ncbi:hypothetical protein PROFUN_05926 [Planoprotostelium fungivorum]|uniref:TLC domain-containing protein n=1 Tax=Planoprotostelium fungivorum TaxID=1890364 RepID=A0A2P6N7N7_9EUKA|nr:hypothetical protein PROFUN_05926 [Planoprotostelium fungivorum]